ncbi:AI-2E family transporter [Bacillus pseudomycoides]|uniref:AI-2E family transporter n=2 Tax=Bacillus pseudomycoides TaxID=64104 RepID=A0ABD6T6Z2_9BACI|nr:AI-2E family transporter [Bacillus pseudomycoides]MCR8858689.1 AI-2E family transporter [Bacillus pseudomycoides]PEK39711.1 AI-2E family transporter [Bacillus pseudomycoides]PEK68446.1 AI-2E family transporter [Bacillus pseudomycoides]PEO45823.1 AI-2E family transporter [Bacillus pseudomycoides]PEP38204.1 AI-2E family transporter [Bacillus pseudomycoides]
MIQMKNFFQSRGFQRLLILVILALILYGLKSMINLILITFILTFLMDRFQRFISEKLNRFVRINRKVIIAFLYIVLVTFIVATLYKYLPVLTIQISQLIYQFKLFFKNPPDNEMIRYVFSAINQMEVSKYIEQGVDVIYQSLANIGKISLQILLSLILSLFFLLEKECIIVFTSKFEDSKLSIFYEEIAYFGQKFARSFGKVIEAQFLIAVVNCILSVIALVFLGFPQLLVLAVMIFLLGLIPVAGVIISLFPLCIIAYNIGGIAYVVYILIFIAVIHAIESYFLNPKFMSAKTNLPIFYTFMVLIFSEHFLGIWGLIIGIPIFIFLLDVLEVYDGEKSDLNTE